MTNMFSYPEWAAYWGAVVVSTRDRKKLTMLDKVHAEVLRLKSEGAINLRIETES